MRVWLLDRRACNVAGHNYIGTEHILLGLLREGEGVAARVLETLGADPSKIRTQVHGYLGSSLCSCHICVEGTAFFVAVTAFAGCTPLLYCIFSASFNQQMSGSFLLDEKGHVLCMYSMSFARD